MLIQTLTTIIETTTEETTGDVAQQIESKVEEANKFLQSLEGYIPKIISFGIQVLCALIIFIVGKLLIKITLKICKKFFEKTNMEISVKKFLLSLIKAILYIILVITMCAQIGIETTSFVAVIGSAGLALGLALQGSLSNFAGGVLILLLKPFKVGDYIVESSGGKEGTVQKIDIFYTTLVTPDNKMTVIPNGNLSNASLTNVTSFDTRRLDIEIGISYSADITKAKELLVKISKENAYVLADNEIFPYVSNLDSSQVTLGLRVWTKTADYWNAKFQIMETIKKEFDNNNIEIPFNQLVVHVENQ